MTTQKGISRKKQTNTEKLVWDYFDPTGKLITDDSVIDRCNKLVIPPAWTDVWISKDSKAKVQAKGYDARGRAQYLYHSDWTKERSELKFSGLVDFAHQLPKIRAKMDADLQLQGMPKDKVVALVVKLMDIYHIRVGNDEYAKKNKSYGLTTLTEGHMRIDRSNEAEGELDAILEFKGKSGKDWQIRIWEDDLAMLIDESGKVGGRKKSQDLFRYEDANGKDYDIKSNHINEYLDSITPRNHKVTAKDFRTWAATWKMASRLSSQLDPEKNAARTRLANLVVKTVCSDLGNTPTVCKSSYIHPSILDNWMNGTFREMWNKASSARRKKGLSKEETITFQYLSDL